MECHKGFELLICYGKSTMTTWIWILCIIFLGGSFAVQKGIPKGDKLQNFVCSFLRLNTYLRLMVELQFLLGMGKSGEFLPKYGKGILRVKLDK